VTLYCAQGGPEREISPAELKQFIFSALDGLGQRKRVLAVPPDYTRVQSRAGELTRYAWEYYKDSLQAVLPALGTHRPMSDEQISAMFGEMPRGIFREHNWRTDTELIGVVPADYIREQSEGKLDYEWPARVNFLVTKGDFDLILSIGQVVPHEVIGMANFNKNILVGTGGTESINRSHYLGAVYGMERIMGRADNPVRNVLNYAAKHFLRDVPIVYILTVIGKASTGQFVVRGVFIGDDSECFNAAAKLSLQVNFEFVAEPVRRAVVYLDPHEFHSTWLGNKAIYRTRMALADDAELIILAPGIREFGEDPTIDTLIRKYGYRGTGATLDAVARNADLRADLSAAAHLIHGSSDDRFQITLCPGHLEREDVENVGFRFGNLEETRKIYDSAKLRHGWNQVNGEAVFFVANPGMGLWAFRERFEQFSALPIAS
jgi:nickel-dependent lactate racemase